MKSFSLRSLLLSVVIAALVLNTARLTLQIVELKREASKDSRKIEMLQVQLMDQVLAQQEGQKLDLLIHDSQTWLAPVTDMINKDPKLSSLLRKIAFESDKPDQYLIFCNPVDNNPESYELFTLTFSGDECTAIKRQALCPW